MPASRIELMRATILRNILEDLSRNRLDLFKSGIQSGIRLRLAIVQELKSQGGAAAMLSLRTGKVPRGAIRNRGRRVETGLLIANSMAKELSRWDPTEPWALDEIARKGARTASIVEANAAGPQVATREQATYLNLVRNARALSRTLRARRQRLSAERARRRR